MGKREEVKKIDTSGKIASGLQNPFAVLDSSALPAGADLPPPVEKPIVPATPKKGRVVLRRETAQRGGKAVIVIGDIPPAMDAAEIEALARQLRKSCGCGGTVRDREIEIQGDQPEKISSILEKMGFRVAGVKSSRC